MPPNPVEYRGLVTAEQSKIPLPATPLHQYLLWTAVALMPLRFTEAKLVSRAHIRGSGQEQKQHLIRALSDYEHDQVFTDVGDKTSEWFTGLRGDYGEFAVGFDTRVMTNKTRFLKVTDLGHFVAAESARHCLTNEISSRKKLAKEVREISVKYLLTKSDVVYIIKESIDNPH